MNLKSKIRLDVFLVEQGLVATRAKAQALIMAGQVLIEGVPSTKVGAIVKDPNTVSLLTPPKYVSRGGEKIEGALDHFAISPAGQVCMDVGSSTGGFTDCLLQRGAQKVFSIDVGTAQMDSRLKSNPKIVLMEQTHILSVEPHQIVPRPTITVIDVSFISLKKIFAKVKELIAPGSCVLAMVKPQFEVGPKLLKKGVVRSEKDQLDAVKDVKAFAESVGFKCQGTVPAQIKGPKGNQEYFLHLK